MILLFLNLLPLLGLIAALYVLTRPALSRYGCTITRLVRFRRWQIELVWCPAHSTIPAHRHPDVYSRIWFLFGHAFVQRGEGGSTLVTWRNLFDGWHPIPPSKTHSLWAGTNGFLFVNIETWLNGVEPDSAAINLIERESSPYLEDRLSASATRRYGVEALKMLRDLKEQERETVGKFMEEVRK